ncbi:rubrerythrin family protein [Micromonospora maritima]|uniref:Rubrerythrin family protein n=2 Tax=Micromonospora maritima TaxID=986711 RepID=A0ABW7ZF79_9ACTN
MSSQLFADLRAAFASESMTAQRYAYFAEIAEIEGHLAVAQTLRELASTTDCVAHGHLDLLRFEADPSTRQPLGDTELNVAAALTGELHESADLYPKLSEHAHDEGLADVASWLETLTALKGAHVTRLQSTLAELRAQELTGRHTAAGTGD